MFESLLQYCLYLWNEWTSPFVAETEWPPRLFSIGSLCYCPRFPVCRRRVLCCISSLHSLLRLLWLSGAVPRKSSVHGTRWVLSAASLFPPKELGRLLAVGSGTLFGEGSWPALFPTRCFLCSGFPFCPLRPVLLALCLFWCSVIPPHPRFFPLILRVECFHRSSFTFLTVFQELLHVPAVWIVL